MSTYNRINWNTSKNLLTRENLNKMSEAIVTCASKTELNFTNENQQNLNCSREIEISDTNTMLTNNLIKANVYTFNRNSKNLIVVDTIPETYKLVNHLNPLPPDSYVLFFFPIDGYGFSDSFISDSPFNINILARRSREEDDPTDTNNLITVLNTSALFNSNNAYGFKDPISFYAPMGIDYISIDTPDGLIPVITRAKDYNEILNGDYYGYYGNSSELDFSVVQNRNNIMPFPYMYEYWRHNPSSVSSGNTVIGNLTFSDMGDGGIKVIKTGEVENSTSFHFHYGTEVEFPADKYTFKCDIYDADTGKLWTGLNSSNSVNDSEKAYGRFLARWEDGDSESYYQDTIQPGTTSSTRPAYNGEHFTFNAFNGIKSIVGSIYIHKGIKNFPSKGLIFRPTLTRGEVPVTTNFNDMPRNNTVYKYVTNLIRPKTPDYYVSGDGTGLGRGLTNGSKVTANGITIENKGGGTFIVNGTASAYSTFIVNPGRYYLNPIGTLYFGNLSSNAP